ncbi:Rust resistance kinase Lr10 [Camellia lanceoleosa]|uniref:Rust resistance kinase Lr10 n=1 Tax=Camellia lanceoleosa TaxID=1840588 RepID=A0ACC0H8E0_9ERIC|nr:Rust resistance kinase Lr10 [Camellia lanceoleosa]
MSWLLSSILLLLLLLLHVLFYVNCDALRSDGNCDSSCGNIQNIRYPFRFEGDPENCGKKIYELACHNNRPLLNLFSSGKYYYVKAINYNNYTIRLVDVGVQNGKCSSLPLYSLSFRDFSNDYSPYRPYSPYSPYRPYSPYEYLCLETVAVLMECENPVNSPLYMNTSSTAYTSCINKTVKSSSSQTHYYYSYFLFGNLSASDVADLCRIDEIVATTLWSPTTAASYNSSSKFMEQLAYGFELSWTNILCENCTGGTCVIDPTTNYTVTCFNYYYSPFKWTFPSFAIPSLQITGFILGARTFCGTPCLFAFLIYKFRTRHLSMFDTIEGFLQSQNNLMPIRYSYWNIKMMTKGFKDKLGEGGFGCVYKGKLRSDHIVAIKILNKPKANGQDFINEVATIGRIHHVNVVQLIGFCADGSKRALVYDFMPNGSLEKYIFSQEGNISLSCKQMYEISLGVARGIEYLHRGCDMQILHFDIKPHNILLDENFTPKVSDFGLAKLYPTDNSNVYVTAARGTMGYMAPELFYKNIGRVSYKVDVYSFGMLLMEMAGRRRNLNAFADHTSQIYFPSWVYDQFKEGKDVEMEESTEEERQMIRKMIITALWCIQMKPDDRPAMNKVVEMLEGNIELVQMPPKPFLTPQEMPTEDN